MWITERFVLKSNKGKVKKMILAIDSSSLVATVGIISENAIIAEYTVNLKKTHSQTLLCMIDEIFKMTGIPKSDIKAIAISDGPGSFTGLRIGASTAKGIAMALNIPIITVSSIELMAYNYNHCNKMICPIMDARRNHVYTGLFMCEEDEMTTIVEPCTIPMEELVQVVKKHNKKTIFIGDGVDAFREYIDENLDTEHTYGLPHMNRQKASALGSIALKMFNSGKVLDADTFAPQYLRLSQAERERMENDKDNAR